MLLCSHSKSGKDKDIHIHKDPMGKTNEGSTTKEFSQDNSFADSKTKENSPQDDNVIQSKTKELFPNVYAWETFVCRQAFIRHEI